MQRVVMLSICTALLCNIFMSYHFYPQLLSHQAGKPLASYIEETSIDRRKLYFIKDAERSNSFEFYTSTLMPGISAAELSTIKKPVWIYTGDNGKAILENYNVSFKILKQVYNYRVSRPKTNFLNPESRKDHLKHHYILAIEE
jgi:hypothetical protein